MTKLVITLPPPLLLLPFPFDEMEIRTLKQFFPRDVPCNGFDFRF